MGRRRQYVTSAGRFGLGIGAFFLLACASAPRPGGGPSSTDLPPAIGSVYVRAFNGEFSRAMRETLVAGLRRSPRVQVVARQVVAELVRVTLPVRVDDPTKF